MFKNGYLNEENIDFFNKDNNNNKNNESGSVLRIKNIKGDLQKENMVSNPNKADKKKLKIITRGKTISTSIRIDVKENITLADVKEEDIAKKSQKIFKSAKKKKLKKRKTKICH